MQFNSYIFILVFLPLILIAYFSTAKFNKCFGKIVLILGSVIFCTYSNVSAFKILGCSLVINFLFAKLIEYSKRKSYLRIFMSIPIIINVGLLLYYKYTNFAISNINLWFGKSFALKDLVLPIGISFFTFQQIAYIVAIYKKEISSVNVFDYITYIIYFPKLLMGPLMDPVDFIAQLNDDSSKKVDWNNIACGVKIFSFGLLKKVLIADTFAKAVSWGFTNVETATSIDWILIMLFYTFEIYFDFSGYSDMAVGTSLMFNIMLPINFDSPYKALSIRDFWKRWHISLTKFFTKYIYIPLGGSKKNIIFTCLNTMIVFLISGIWHGANWTFILWGILHGLLSIFDRLFDRNLKKMFEPARWLATFIIVNILWLLFRADSVQQWATILYKVIGFSNTTVSAGLLNTFSIPETAIIFDIFPIFAKLNTHVCGFMMLVFTFISFAICILPENNYKNLKKLSILNMILAAGSIILGITCLSGESVFVYFNF